MSYKKILEIVPVMQSAALAGENMKFANKKDKGVGDFTKAGIKNIVGSKLIGDTSNIIGSL